jgi:hypothetical protein
VVDFRVYRLAFLPALGAVIAIMFSLEGTPRALEPGVPPAAFEGEGAAAVARQLAARAPEREPGSDGDLAAARLVAQRFAEIPGAIVAEQEIDSTYDGEDVALRNVVLTIPGEADGTVAVVAARAAPSTPGAASSAAATGVLVELASVLAASGHDHTYLLASTGDVPASAGGVADALELAPEADPVDAVVVISQPGTGDPAQPFLVSTSTGPESAPAQLVETAGEAVTAQVGEEPERASAPLELARLALPAGIGPQAALIADGTDAVTISAAGERQLPPSADQVDDLSGETVDAFGRAVHATVVAVDAAVEPLEHGPGAYVEVGDNLVPGWTLALLGLALILPALVVAVDSCARVLRRRAGLLRALSWALARGLPLIGCLAVLYGLALAGVVPRPDFPFDPGLYPLGARAGISLGVIALAGAGSAMLLRQAPAARYPNAPDAAVVGAGAVSVGAVAMAWAANPYLGLLLAPCAHVWLLAVGSSRRGPRRVFVGIAALLSLAPVVAAIIAVAAALDLGADLPWTATLMIADGQIGIAVALAAAFVCASLVAVTRLAATSHQGPTIPGSGWGPPPKAPTGTVPGPSNER